MPGVSGRHSLNVSGGGDKPRKLSNFDTFKASVAKNLRCVCVQSAGLVGG